MEKNNKKIIKCNMIPELLLIILGGILYFCLDLSATSISWLVGSFLIIKGVIQIIAFKKETKIAKLFKYSLMLGLFSILFAIILIINIYTLKININVLIGIYFIVSAIYNCLGTYVLAKISNQSKIILFIIGFIGIILGIIMMFNLLEDLFFFNKSSGILFAFYAILNIMALMILKKNVKSLK